MKKLFALTLALALLASCAPALAAFHESGLPIVDETFTFSLLVDDNGLAEDKLMYPILEQETNVHVNLILYPYETALEKLGILLNSGDYPEVIGGWLLGKKDILELGMGEGVFIPLEELFAQYAPNVMQTLETEGVREAFTLPDGHIYTLPYVIGEPLVTFMPWINQVWLDRLGLAMPTTPEEFKEVLVAFRDQDANGNGDPSDEIPFSSDPNNMILGALAGWYGVDASHQSDYPYFAMVDGDIQFSANTDEFKTFIEYFADLYKEGLVDPELFTQDLAMWKSKGQQNLYGSSIAYGPGDFYDDNEDKTNDFTHLPVLKGCDAPIFHRNSYGVTFFRTQVVLTDKCDAEAAAIIVRWFDNTFTEDNSAQLQWGPLGIALEKVEDGVYREADRTDWTDEQKEIYGWGNYYTQSLPKFMRDMVLLPAEGSEPTVSNKDIADEAYAPYLNETFAKVWSTDEADIDRSAILTKDIEGYVKSKIAQWISGEADVTAEWDQYKAQLEAYGLSELTEINRRALFGE